MLTKRIIPCLDVTKGRVVKGVNFVNLRDAGDPVELAAFYNQEGADEVVFLDITASYENRATMLDVVRRTAERVFIPVTVGGGIRTVEDIRATLGAGADKTSLNTAAVQKPDLLRAGAELFGAQCIVLAIDARSSATMPSGYEVFIHGGTHTGQASARSRASGPLQIVPSLFQEGPRIALVKHSASHLHSMLSFKQPIHITKWRDQV